MDFLDLPLRSLILNDLARNIASTASDDESVGVATALADSVKSELFMDDVDEADEREGRSIMSSSLTDVNVSFTTFCAHLPAGHPRLVENIDLLLALLRDLPETDFEYGLAWPEWALPDQLAHGVIGALFKISGELEDAALRRRALDAVGAFVKALANRIDNGDPLDAVVHSVPIFHGLYRSLTSVAHPFDLSTFTALASGLSDLLVPSTVDRLNQLLLGTASVLAFGGARSGGADGENGEHDPSTTRYAFNLLARYRANGRPLSGNFLVCAGLEMQWTMLAQVLAPPSPVKLPCPVDDDGAEAANAAWEALLSGPALQPILEDGSKRQVEHVLETALRCYTDTTGAAQAWRGEGDVVADLYTFEIVSESLKLAALCSVVLGQPDASLLSRIKLLLSENAPVFEPLVQEAALQSLMLLVINFPALAHPMALHLRRFVASPLQIFELDHSASSLEGSPVLAASARCLALCITIADGDDLVTSTMYSLLNYLTSSSSGQPPATGAGAQYATSTLSGIAGGAAVAADHRDPLETMTMRTHGFGRTDEQRRHMNASTIAVVTRLAIEFKKPEVTHVTISMLLQRLRSADVHTEATIVANLVPLALVAPKIDFIDVIQALSLLSRTPNLEDPKRSSSAVLAAQTRLGQALKGRPDLCDAYLVELLQLFSDSGTNVQTLAAGKREDLSPFKRATAAAATASASQGRTLPLSAGGGVTSNRQEGAVAELTSQLAGLILPIEAVLAHADYHPDQAPTSELIALFRNMWFLTVVLGIPTSLDEWHHAALARVALKTPALILESAQDYVESDLEYNSILRRDFSPVVLSRQRAALAELLPGHASEIKNFTLAQVTLLQTVHLVEGMRTRLGKPSTLLAYFCNESVNESHLSGPLDGIATKIIRSYTDALQQQALSHNIPTSIAPELQHLLVGCTHRFQRVRDVSLAYLETLLQAFPSLMCDARLVFALLEVLTLMRNSCEEEYTDEYSPIYEHRSARGATLGELKLELSDSFRTRNEITARLYGCARTWLTAAIARSPIEVQTILQRYLAESRDVLLPDSVEMGAGLALHYAKIVSSADRKASLMPNIGGWPSDNANLLASRFATKNYFAGEHSGVRLILRHGLGGLQEETSTASSVSELTALKMQMARALKEIDDKTSTLSTQDLRRLLFRAAAILISSKDLDNDILHYLVWLPFRAFSPRAVAAGTDAWTWLVSERPSAEMALLAEVVAGWTWTIHSRKGLFNTVLNSTDPFVHPIEYSPSNKATMDKALAAVQKLLMPHLILIQVLASRFQAVKYREPGLINVFIRVLIRSCIATKHISTHALAREARFTLLLFGLQVLQSSRLETLLELKLRDGLFDVLFGWFANRPQWSYGSNRIQINAEIKLLQEVLSAMSHDKIRPAQFTSSRHVWNQKLPNGMSITQYTAFHKERLHVAQILIEDEIGRLSVWQNPLGDAGRAHTTGPDRSSESWPRIIQMAWSLNPAVAVHMAERLKYPAIITEVTKLVRARPKDVIDVPEALAFLLGDRIEPSARHSLQWLLLWAPVPPVTAVTYFQPRFESHPIVLQYAMRVLEKHPVDLTFFFVPQVVQALRTDKLGYVERFIFETSKVSQLFCHQMIWNMKANCYKDDSGTIEDPMKPILDRMVDRVAASLSGEARAFYDREFTFFNEVTSISGKLKPFIKKTKPEKKAKIDEEMAKIVVDAGVYLPSNPDGVVVDIDKKSGRPLQSHAKAPFMATFKVRKERVVIESLEEDSVLDPESRINAKTHYDVWQQAIFKVGDDCRQDVLALQIIAMFKNIFTGMGLVLYLFPYRVTATAPGCGVIDVVPNATSRDEMGRAKVNDLLSFFVDKYGSVDTVPFQRARMNFIQSMAAYSIACYILQIKDRHNGNIMIDGEGHIVHIDFGFLFDIGPGGVKFEPNSFKLNHEMVVLMGGRDSQGYRIFQELTIKAFLAIRPHAEQLISTVNLMLETGLPSFKGEGTIHRLRERFQLGLSEKQAAAYMMRVIKDAHENKRSTFYDEFQRIQNGIPYA